MRSTGFYDTLGANHFLEEDEAVGYLFYHKLDPPICIYECPFKVFKECQNLPKRIYPQLPQPHPNRMGQSVHEILPQDLAQELEGDTPPTVVDVREPSEFKKGHISTAINIPLTTMLTHPENLPTDNKIIFVCRSGPRSQKAALREIYSGNSNVAILKGGTLTWEMVYPYDKTELLTP